MNPVKPSVTKAIRNKLLDHTFILGNVSQHEQLDFRGLSRLYHRTDFAGSLLSFETVKHL
jgi:hypothetical protein